MQIGSIGVKRLWLYYLILILALSSIPGNPSRGGLAPYGVDKVFHFLLYFGFGIVFARAYAAGRSGGSFLLLLILASGLIGLADEVYQGFIPGRSQEGLDWLADFCGGICGGLVFLRRMKGAARIREKV